MIALRPLRQNWLTYTLITRNWDWFVRMFEPVWQVGVVTHEIPNIDRIGHIGAFIKCIFGDMCNIIFGMSLKITEKRQKVQLTLKGRKHFHYVNDFLGKRDHGDILIPCCAVKLRIRAYPLKISKIAKLLKM